MGSTIANSQVARSTTTRKNPRPLTSSRIAQGATGTFVAMRTSTDDDALRFDLDQSGFYAVGVSSHEDLLAGRSTLDPCADRTRSVRHLRGASDQIAAVARRGSAPDWCTPTTLTGDVKGCRPARSRRSGLQAP